MKCVILVGFLVTLLGQGYGNVVPVRCTSDGKDKVLCDNDDDRVQNKLPAGKECAPGSTWRSRCNTCTCTPSGYAACTDAACGEQETKPEIRCAANTVWKNDCNTCWCTSHGRAMCTRVGCVINPDVKIEDIPEVNDKDTVEEIEREFLNEPIKVLHTQVHKGVETESKKSDQKLSHNLLKRSVCKPNQAFQSECNSCQCSSDGQSYTCTQNECLERDMTKEVEVFMESEGVDHIERHSVCKPSDTFYIGCNTCHCNPSGTDYSCTNKPCPLPDDVELFHEFQEMKPIVPYTGYEYENSTNKPKL